MLLASERCASATFTCGTHRAKPLVADKNCIFCKRENGIALPADWTKASFGNKNWSKKGAGRVKVYNAALAAAAGRGEFAPPPSGFEG